MAFVHCIVRSHRNRTTTKVCETTISDREVKGRKTGGAGRDSVIYVCKR